MLVRFISRRKSVLFGLAVLGLATVSLPGQAQSARTAAPAQPNGTPVPAQQQRQDNPAQPNLPGKLLSSPPQQLRLAANDTLGAIGQKAILKATLTTAGGQPVAGGEITFVLPGVQASKKITGASGAAEAEFVVPMNFKLGSNTFVATFDGKVPGGSASALEAKANINIVKGMSRLILTPDFTNMEINSATGFAYPTNKQVRLLGKLMASGNSAMPLAGQKVLLGYGSKKESRITGNDGGFQTVFDRSPGVIGDPMAVDLVNVSFEGNDAFLASGETMKVTYSPPRDPAAPPPFIMTSKIVDGQPVKLLMSDKTKVMVKLQYQTPAKPPVPNAPFTLFAVENGNEKGILGSGVTNSAGEAVLELNNPCSQVGTGDFLMFATWDKNGKRWRADDNYPAKLDLEVTKADVVVTVPAQAKIGSAIPVEVRVLRNDNKKPLADIHFDIFSPPQYNGFTGAGGKTNAQGIGIYQLPITGAMGLGAKHFKLRANSTCTGYTNGGFDLVIQPSGSGKPVQLEVKNAFSTYGQVAVLQASALSLPKGAEMGQIATQPGISPAGPPPVAAAAPGPGNAAQVVKPAPSLVPFAGAKLLFKVDGRPAGSATTNANGIAIVNFPVVAVIDAYDPAHGTAAVIQQSGNREVTVEYVGEDSADGYASAKAKGNLSLFKAPTEIEVNYDVSADPNTLYHAVKVPGYALGNAEFIKLFNGDWELKIGSKTLTVPQVFYHQVKTYTSVNAVIPDGTPISVVFNGSEGLLASSWSGVIKNGKAVKK